MPTPACERRTSLRGFPGVAVSASSFSSTLVSRCFVAGSMLTLLLAGHSAVLAASGPAAAIGWNHAGREASRAGITGSAQRRTRGASASCGSASTRRPASFAYQTSVATHVEVPSVVDVSVGSMEDITVQVTPDGSHRVPVGYVSLWDADIPSNVQFVPHTAVGKGSLGHSVCLDAEGKATFELKETLPGVPFDIEVPKGDLYFEPLGGGFGSSHNNEPFELKMHIWPANLSVKLGRHAAKGRAVPVDVSVSSAEATPPGEAVPAGDVAILDVSHGRQCGARVTGAFPYRGSGQATIYVDLPAGKNTLVATYLGDAYYGPQRAPDSSIAVKKGGRPRNACPKNWARLGRGIGAVASVSRRRRDTLGGHKSGPYDRSRAGLVPSVPSLSVADVPMFRYGFPPTAHNRKNTVCCYGDYSPAALANPEVATFVVQLDWSDVQPSPGVFDFGPADDEVRAAISQGKRVALVLRFQAGSVLSGTGTLCGYTTEFLPSWVVDRLGNSDSFCSHGATLTIPKYWGAAFVQLWKSFVDQAAAHFAPYAADIAYVRAPVGLGDEAVALTGPNSKPIKADVRHLVKWEYNPQLWEAWQEDMLSYYRQDFSYAPWVLYTINKQDVNSQCSGPVQISIPTFQPRTVPCTGKPVEVDVAEWAVDQGFGLAQNSLDGSWIWSNPAKDDPPAGDVNTIFKYALRHTPHPFIELQTAQAQSSWCNLAVVKGLPHCGANRNAFVDAEDDVSYARSHGVSAIEWYEADLNDPNLQPVIDLWRQLQAIPGTDKIPTVVTVTPAQTSVLAGSNLSVTITISAPGIAGFIPGGTVVLSDDITGHRPRSVQIPPDTGTVTVNVRVPITKYGHINLTASYTDTFTVGTQMSGTLLWLPSTAPNVRVLVVPAG
jgi:hypothetical protein